MDEDELELYLDSIDRIDPLLSASSDAYPYEVGLEQLRDESGFRVPGCYRVPPTAGQG